VTGGGGGFDKNEKQKKKKNSWSLNSRKKIFEFSTSCIFLSFD
jgi:hypothetical protein